MYMRALADFDNYRRRVERERTSAAQSGKREIILSMIEALDGFDRALQQMGNDADSSVVEGLQAIRRRLQAVLEAQGVTPFSSLGEVFNPELHEAIGSVKTDASAPGVVVDEAQRGYRWGETVLRPARVRVAQ
jgi:molecular chaperone GrpE